MGIVRVVDEGQLKFGDRLRIPTGLQEGEPEVSVKADVLRAEGQGPLEQRQRRRPQALTLERVADVAETHGTRWIEVECTAPERLVVPPLLYLGRRQCREPDEP